MSTRNWNHQFACDGRRGLFARSRLRHAFVCTVVLVASVAASPAAHASFTTLEVVPEVTANSHPQGVQTLTAILSEPAPAQHGATRVLFELTGTNDRDGNSPSSPDFSCLVPAGADSCTVAYHSGALAPGADRVRAWIDVTGNPVFADCRQIDCSEGRYAGPTDCGVSHPLFPDASGACPPDGVAAPGTRSEPDETDVVEVAWGAQPTQVNRHPDCSGASVDPSRLTLRDGSFRPVTVGGASDPDGDAVRHRITAVTQDEPVGSTSPDARTTDAPNVVELRDEREGSGDGRVYRISFTADDGRGGTCSGVVRVAVPHDAKRDAVESELEADSFGTSETTGG